MDSFLLALPLVFRPDVLGVIAMSAIFGLFVGAIPGLTATMATALLVPLTFFMDPVPALASIVTATAMAIRSEEHTSELQSLMRISYAVFCLKKTKNRYT